MIKKQRNTNLELFRIISMFFIIAHHYVVNSGLMDKITTGGGLLLKNISLLLFGAWGKTCINSFVLITGYFMCKSNISFEKFIKLLFEYMFYNIIIYLIFLFSGYSMFNIKELVKALLPIYSIKGNFISCFLIFYLLIPFINILINHINEKHHRYLLSICLFTYVLMGTIPYFSVSMNYVSWFIVLYLIASYIRYYPKEIYNNSKIWGILSLVLIIIACASIIVCLYLGVYPYKFVSDSNTFLALAIGICLFLFFNNLNIKYNKAINTIASTTFGILCIHANSDTMRQWLWKDTLNNVGAYYTNYSLLHALGSTILVFIICSLIDLLRINYIEKTFMNKFDKIINNLFFFNNKDII